MKKFWDKVWVGVVFVAALVWGFVEFVIPMLYEKRRSEAAKKVEATKAAVEAKHEERKAEAEVAKAEITKAAEEQKQGDMVALANDIIAGKK